MLRCQKLFDSFPARPGNLLLVQTFFLYVSNIAKTCLKFGWDYAKTPKIQNIDPVSVGSVEASAAGRWVAVGVGSGRCIEQRWSLIAIEQERALPT